MNQAERHEYWNSLDFTNPDECPDIDYLLVPDMPRTGVQSGGNNAYVTRSLFLETAPSDKEKDALWCMAEHEIWAHGRWYPSAWKVYIYSTDEYEALRRICGNVKQWTYIKEMFEKVGRGHILEAWEAEQGLIQKSILRRNLMTAAADGKVGAAKMVMEMIDGKAKIGRPKKDKPDARKDNLDDAASEAMKRVVDFSQ